MYLCILYKMAECFSNSHRWVSPRVVCCQRIVKIFFVYIFFSFHSRGTKTHCTWLFQIESNTISLFSPLSEQQCEPEHDYIIYFRLEFMRKKQQQQSDQEEERKNIFHYFHCKIALAQSRLKRHLSLSIGNWFFKPCKWSFMSQMRSFSRNFEKLFSIL